VEPRKPDDEREEIIGPPDAQVGAPAPDAPDDIEYEDEPVRGRFGGRLAAIALVCAVLSTLSLAWIGGELHYRNCLETAAIRVQGQNDDFGRLIRNQAANSCSRSPF
jgi:hypothetical protein